jgi:sodium/bile acid cotransporter 7
LAIFIPPKGNAAAFFSVLTNLVVFFLFFLHGAKLSPKNLIDGLSSVKAHVVIILSTFVMFPLITLLLGPLFNIFLSPELCLGLLFLAALPSTVQSSITFTSIAKGNVAAAVCAASFSSLLGVILTPVLVGILIKVPGGSPFKLSVLWDLFLQLLLPFALGQILRPRIIGFLQRHGGIISFTDRLSVIFIVFVSFSHAVTEGLWKNLTLSELISLVFACGLILSLALLITSLAGRLLGFDAPDRAAILFCGSKKSLMAGAPMAGIIFTHSVAGVVMAPLIIFHQMQLLACAQIARVLAKRNEKRNETRTETPPEGKEGGEDGG